MVGEFKFYGKTVEELKDMDLKEFVKLIPARQRRSVARGFSEEKKKFLENWFLEICKKKTVSKFCEFSICVLFEESCEVIPEIIRQRNRERVEAIRIGFKKLFIKIYLMFYWI